MACRTQSTISWIFREHVEPINGQLIWKRLFYALTLSLPFQWIPLEIATLGMVKLLKVNFEKKCLPCHESWLMTHESWPWHWKKFSEISGSNYYHNQIRFGTYKGNPIAIGDGYEGHNKVEIMNINREDGSHTWSDGARWPFRFRLVW